MWRCSGTLISPKVFLTAGHCTEAPAAHAEIWFDADVQSGIPANGYPNKGRSAARPYTHPQYNPDAFYLYDLGVVVLDKPVKMAQYGALPKLNVLDEMKKRRHLHRRRLRPAEGLPRCRFLEGPGLSRCAWSPIPS